MSKSRLEWKVGLFVFLGLLLAAALLIQFTKGATFFRPTYTILLRSQNVGGLKPGADVLMSGVRVGTVSDIQLAPDGMTVIIPLRIYSRYLIHKDARFLIEQAGFLGDQYVAIMPTDNRGGVFHDKEEAQAEAPFNLQEVARSATGFVKRIDETARKLNETLVDVRRFVLNQQTLTNLSVTVENMRAASDRAATMVDNVNALVLSSQPPLEMSSSNLYVFSRQLNQFGDELNSLVNTNTGSINTTIKNLEASSEVLKGLLNDLQAGKGVAGALLRNDQMAANMAQIASNLSITTSNLNRLGLWGILWKREEPSPEPPVKPLTSPKNSG